MYTRSIHFQGRDQAPSPPPISFTTPPRFIYKKEDRKVEFYPNTSQGVQAVVKALYKNYEEKIAIIPKERLFFRDSHSGKSYFKTFLTHLHILNSEEDREVSFSELSDDLRDQLLDQADRSQVNLIYYPEAPPGSERDSKLDKPLRKIFAIIFEVSALPVQTIEEHSRYYSRIFHRNFEFNQNNTFSTDSAIMSLQLSAHYGTIGKINFKAEILRSDETYQFLAENKIFIDFSFLYADRDVDPVSLSSLTTDQKMSLINRLEYFNGKVSFIPYLDNQMSRLFALILNLNT